MSDLQSSVSADREDRLLEHKSPREFLLLGLVAVLALCIVAAWFYFNSGTETSEKNDQLSIPPIKEIDDLPEPSVPDIPYSKPTPRFDDADLPSNSSVDQFTTEKEQPSEEQMIADIKTSLPELSDSRLLLKTFFSPNLIERIAAITDSSSRGIVLTRMLSLVAPPRSFQVASVDGVLVLDPISYQRYDPYVEAVSSIEAEVIERMFHDYRPYLESAYATLGYDKKDFDNAVIKTLDQIIAAPIVRDLIRVERHEAIYRFVDEELESLSGLHKQLVRMGPDNIEKLKSIASELRGLLLQRGE